MSIDYSTYIAYGFPFGRKLDEEKDEPLLKVLKEEGLRDLWCGNLVLGTNIQDFIVIASTVNEVDCDGAYKLLDLGSSRLGMREVRALLDRADEMVNLPTVGWHLITVVS